MEDLDLILDDLEKTKELDLSIVEDYEVEEDEIEILEELDNNQKKMLFDSNEENVNE